MRIWRKFSSFKYALNVVNYTNDYNVYVVKHIKNAKHLFCVTNFMVIISLAITLVVNVTNIKDTSMTLVKIFFIKRVLNVGLVAILILF